jgi:Domain of unknown function (DUF1127)
MQPTRRAGLFSRLRNTTRHRDTRAGLMELDNHLLRDIGLSREVLLYSEFMGGLASDPVGQDDLALRARPAALAVTAFGRAFALASGVAVGTASTSSTAWNQ